MFTPPLLGLAYLLLMLASHPHDAICPTPLPHTPLAFAIKRHASAWRLDFELSTIDRWRGYIDVVGACCSCEMYVTTAIYG